MAGVSRSSLFTEDWDLDTIIDWPIGPDAYMWEISTIPSGVELLYPVVPSNALNKVLTRMGSKEWRAASKTSSPVVRRLAPSLRFRVNTSYMPTFEANLQANLGEEVRLRTPGYRPFGVNSEDNWTRLVDYSEPQREDGGKTYLVEAVFRYLRAFP